MLKSTAAQQPLPTPTPTPTPTPVPLPVARAIRKLGADISLARRRRRFTQVSLAERMGASLSTVRRMEQGDPKLPIHFYARALHLFGEIKALENLLDTVNDSIGLALVDEQLPKRVRLPKNRELQGW